MFKCSKCIFYDKKGYNNMGPMCMFDLVLQKRKMNHNEPFDLYKCFITYDLKAEECDYFTFVSDAVDIIKEFKERNL